MTDTMPLMLTIEEARQVLRVGQRKAYEMVREGQIPTVRFGRTYRVPRRELEKLVGGPLDAGFTKAGDIG